MTGHGGNPPQKKIMFHTFKLACGPPNCGHPNKNSISQSRGREFFLHQNKMGWLPILPAPNKKQMKPWASPLPLNSSNILLPLWPCPSRCHDNRIEYMLSVTEPTLEQPLIKIQTQRTKDYILNRTISNQRWIMIQSRHGYWPSRVLSVHGYCPSKFGWTPTYQYFLYIHNVTSGALLNSY